jgi:hypothetical protein
VRARCRGACQRRVGRVSAEHNIEAVEPPALARNTRAMRQSPPESDDDFTRWLESRPEDDEPLNPEERAALARSDADIAAGRTVSFEEIKAINDAAADLPPDHAFTDTAAPPLGGTTQVLLSPGPRRATLAAMPRSATRAAVASDDAHRRPRYLDVVTVKERLHHAIEAMSDDEARAALRTLADASGDPVAWMLDHAPLDDEPETDEERQAVAEARADRERGIKPVPLEDVLAEFDAE